jgi:alpha-galactosidase/6-phospho-beta-glucosidase family protein
VSGLPSEAQAKRSAKEGVESREAKREHLYHAAMLDPNTSATLTLPQIWKLMDAMICAHGSGLPRFAR